MSTGLSGFDGKTDTAIGAVTGIRSWSIRSDGLRGSASGLWVSGENIAECSNEGSVCEPPVEECGCGFWAYWKNAARFYTSFDVTGVIEGYGRTLIGPRGFRSEKARIVALSILHSVNVDQMVAVQSYGVTLYASIKEMLDAHPLTDEYYEPLPDYEDFGGNVIHTGTSVSVSGGDIWTNISTTYGGSSGSSHSWYHMGGSGNVTYNTSGGSGGGGGGNYASGGIISAHNQEEE